MMLILVMGDVQAPKMVIDFWLGYWLALLGGFYRKLLT